MRSFPHGRALALALTLYPTDAAVEDFYCGREPGFAEVNTYLNGVFLDPSTGSSGSSLGGRLLENIERVDAYLQAFGFRVGAGVVGWANLFEPFQGCPLPFISLEMAYAMRIWNGTDGFPYGLRALSRPPSTSHWAKALALTVSWHTWANAATRSAPVELAELTGRLCSQLSKLLGLEEMAQIALLALKWRQASLAQLLGCEHGSSSPGWSWLETKEQSFEAFWAELGDALRRSPTLQMPWSSGIDPYMLKLVMHELQISARHRTQEAELYLEFGVYQGESLNFIARHLRALPYSAARSPRVVHGFDSFRGLPTAWRDGSEIPGALSFGRNSFALDQLPEVEDNVRLVPGWFNETIPAFRAGLEAAGGATIRLLHIDAGQDEGNGWCISAAWKTSHKRMQHGVFTYT
ncbi:unnamed protein product [Durusdinium trenchii]|uniref:Uncharacterized protein n=1 Tax=Durusdinium trenchii TaxID=1381693 RepID=A0ABP0J1Z9_9DINO